VPNLERRIVTSQIDTQEEIFHGGIAQLGEQQTEALLENVF
jgi:hypothetical protein